MSMKFCPQCGSQLRENAKFCNMCGEKIIDNSVPNIDMMHAAPPQREISGDIITLQRKTKRYQTVGNILLLCSLLFIPAVCIFDTLLKDIDVDTKGWILLSVCLFFVVTLILGVRFRMRCSSSVKKLKGMGYDYDPGIGFKLAGICVFLGLAIYLSYVTANNLKLFKAFDRDVSEYVGSIPLDADRESVIKILQNNNIGFKETDDGIIFRNWNDSCFIDFNSDGSLKGMSFASDVGQFSNTLDNIEDSLGEADIEKDNQYYWYGNTDDTDCEIHLFTSKSVGGQKFTYVDITPVSETKRSRKDILENALVWGGIAILCVIMVLKNISGIVKLRTKTN